MEKRTRYNYPISPQISPEPKCVICNSGSTRMNRERVRKTKDGNVCKNCILKFEDSDPAWGMGLKAILEQVK